MAKYKNPLHSAKKETAAERKDRLQRQKKAKAFFAAASIGPTPNWRYSKELFGYKKADQRELVIGALNGFDRDPASAIIGLLEMAEQQIAIGDPQGALVTVGIRVAELCSRVDALAALLDKLRPEIAAKLNLTAGQLTRIKERKDSSTQWKNLAWQLRSEYSSSDIEDRGEYVVCEEMRKSYSSDLAERHLSQTRLANSLPIATSRRIE